MHVERIQPNCRKLGTLEAPIENASLGDAAMQLEVYAAADGGRHTSPIQCRSKGSAQAHEARRAAVLLFVNELDADEPLRIHCPQAVALVPQCVNAH